MFYSISWNTYWTILGLCTVGYYVIVYLVYFKGKLPLVLTKQQKAARSQEFYLSAEDPKAIDVLSDAAESIVENCIDELNAYFEAAKKNKCVREEIIHALQNILKKYPTLKYSEFRATLSNIIITQCEHICSIHLKAEDMVFVWSVA